MKNRPHSLVSKYSRPEGREVGLGVARLGATSKGSYIAGRQRRTGIGQGRVAQGRAGQGRAMQVMGYQCVK